MVAVHGYYNGAVCVPLEKEHFFMNQKVIITALDENRTKSPQIGNT